MNKKAQSFGLPAVVGAILVVGILLAIGVKVSSSVNSSIDTDDLTSTENDTFTEIKTNTFDAYELSGTGQIVLAAAGILAVVATGLVIFSRR